MKKHKKTLEIGQVISGIAEIAKKIRREVTLMEVCGTHTQAIGRFGIRKLLPENIKLLSGPGCPVCVTAQEDIDMVIHLANSGIPVATYGDMLRVPGYGGNLESVKAGGAKVFSVYSVEEVIDLQKAYPQMIFFGMGFDTTAPMTAYLLSQGVPVYSTHKLFLPAMDALLAMGELNIDGFISPGHVSTIVGTKPYAHMDVAQVITGFTAEDILVGIYMLLKQITSGRKNVENEYVRSVRQEGNLIAKQMIEEYFFIFDGNWRGFGMIPNSGLEVKNDKLNAKIIYADVLNKMNSAVFRKRNACRCGEVIRGLINPRKCPMFGNACTPEKPFGPCMVSSEGVCNAEFRYLDDL